MRAETDSAVARLQAHGDHDVHYVDGQRLYGLVHAQFSPDGLPPRRRWAARARQRFLREVVAPYFA
jgi:hypothetical protein